MPIECPSCHSGKVRIQFTGTALRDIVVLLIAGLAALVGLITGLVTGEPVLLLIGGVTLVAFIAALAWFMRKERPYICLECGATWKHSPFDYSGSAPSSAQPSGRPVASSPVPSSSPSKAVIPPARSRKMTYSYLQIFVLAIGGGLIGGGLSGWGTELIAIGIAVDVIGVSLLQLAKLGSKQARSASPQNSTGGSQPTTDLPRQPVKSPVPAAAVSNTCSHCGHSFLSSTKFCDRCGAPVESGAEQAAVDAPSRSKPTRSPKLERRSEDSVRRNEQWLLQQAIAAARAGRKAEARQFLERVLRTNARNEQACLWMSALAGTDVERIEWLQRALAINPNNAAARKELARLQACVGTHTPQPMDQPASIDHDSHQASEPRLWPIPEPPPSKRPPPARPKPRLRLQGPWVVVAVLATLAMLALCLVGGGGLLYWGIFARPEPTIVQMAPMLTQTAETQSELLATHSPTPVPHTPTSLPPTSTALPAPSATPSSSPTPSPTPCAIAAAPRFDAAWRLYADQLGCALNQAHTQAAASQDFERGFLLWREDPDYVYVMHDDGRLGLYPMDVYPESVRLNPPGADPSIVPPAGLIQPVRGFGLVWRDNPDVRDGVGWALENEARADWYYKFVVQDFAGGAILHECRMGVRVLLWDGAWFQVSSGEPCN